MTEARLCVVCPVRRQTVMHYERAQVCQPCRIWLAETIADVGALYRRFVDQPRIESDSPWKTRQLDKGHWVTQPGYDPVSGEMPTAANGARIGGDMVSGSREAPVPINVDAVDLTLPPHGDRLTAEGRLWWEDQIGHLSVAMELDLIARSWAAELRHRLPDPTVPALTVWLCDRTEWACDRYLGVDADAETIARLRGTLRTMVGDVPPRPERMGAPCPGCDLVTMVRRPGEDKVECANGDCRRVLTVEEYDRWSGLVVADLGASQGDVVANAP